jgi:hypothetical protein
MVVLREAVVLHLWTILQIYLMDSISAWLKMRTWFALSTRNENLANWDPTTGLMGGRRRRFASPFVAA